MARPKGSKNKATRVKRSSYDEQIALEGEERDRLILEKASLEATITESRERLKETNKLLRTSERRLAKLEAKKAEADAEAAAAAKRLDIQNAIAALLDGGMTEDEVLAKLNK